MFPYIIFLGFILLCYYKKWPKGMLISMVVFSVLRYDTGWDYMSYTDVVSSTWQWVNPEHSRFSFLWRQLFSFAHNYNIPHLAIILPNILTYICIYWGLNLLNLSRQEKVDAMLVYICWYELYLGSFSIIRQGLSMGLGFMMFALLQKKYYVWAIAVYVLAVHIHTSSCALALLFPIYFIRDNLNFKWMCIGVILIVLALSSIGEIISSIESVDLAKYQTYLKMQDNYGGKIIFINIILVAYLTFVFFISKRLSSFDRQCYFLTIMSLTGNIVIFLMGLSSILSRVFSYFIVFMIPILLSSLNAFREHKILKDVSVLLLCIFMIVYLDISKAGNKVASSGFIPYKCILLR